MIYHLRKHPRGPWRLLTPLAVCLLGVLGGAADAQAQLDPEFGLVRDKTGSSEGFEMYAGLSSVGRGGNASSGEPVAGALGAYLSTDFWKWGETAKISEGLTGRDSQWSVWPLFGMRWGTEGGAVLSGHLLGCLTCDGEQADLNGAQWQASQWVTLHSGIFNFLQTADYQRPSRFDDAYWRAERNLTSLGFGMELPFTVRYEDKHGVRVDLQQFSFYGRQLLGVGEETDYTDLEFDIGVAFLEVVSEHKYSSFVGEFLTADVNLFAQPDAPIVGGDSSNPFDFQFAFADMRGITFDDGRNTFGLKLGIRVILPASIGDRDALLGPEDETNGFEPDLMLRFASRQRVRGRAPSENVWRKLDDVSYQVALGTFQRIGPSGFGVDSGWQLRLDGAVPLDEEWSLRAEAVGVSAERIIAAPLPASSEIADAGTDFLMGRAEVGLTHEFTERLMLDLNLWGERSDRYDPRPAGLTETGEVSFRLGVAASLTSKVF